MMYLLVIGALVGMLILVFTHMWDVTRDLRMVVRRQGDELNKAKSDIMQMQAQLADVSFYIKYGRSRDRDKQRFDALVEKALAKETLDRPGEVDQELLLR